MITTLITPTEVIAKGKFDQNFDPNLIEPFISLAEYRYLSARESFIGKDFYEALKSDVIPYADYSVATTYNSGDTVIYEGKYYSCLINGTFSILPGSSTHWGQVAKFTTPDNQMLWELYLQEYIAIAVQHSSTYKNAFRSTSKGIMRNESEFSKPAEYGAVKALKDELMSDLMVLQDGMLSFLVANADKYPAFNNLPCPDKAQTKMGLYLKNKNAA